MYVRLTPAQQYGIEDDASIPQRLRDKVTRARRRRAELNCAKVRVTSADLVHIRRVLGPYVDVD